jgi:hypothetical protein
MSAITPEDVANYSCGAAPVLGLTVPELLELSRVVPPLVPGLGELLLAPGSALSVPCPRDAG